MISLTAISLLAGGLFLVAYLAYRALLPKPLPGIPYNKDAANKLFGDVPEVMGYVKSTKQIYAWFTELAVKHKSPIVQAFIKPGSLPWVVVTDPYEIQDILLRRTKDFDRASFFHDVLSGIIQYQASQYVSDHPIYKHNKNLINHLMAPSFINTISAPEIYKSVTNLIQVWEQKCEKAQGRPFAAHHDITYQALDFIFAALFEVTGPDSITYQRLQTITSYTAPPPSSPGDMTPVPFPDGPVPQPQASLLKLTDSIMHTQLSPFPTLTSTIHTKFPSMRHAIKTKETFYRDKINEAIGHINSDPNAPAHNAIHSVLLRERETALKENRPPDYHQRGIYDEFVGLVMAGHDTSATSVAWAVKYLAAFPAVQSRLRKELKAAFPEAAKENRSPKFEELLTAHIPYLDAVNEEVLRLASSIDFVVRVALRDTTVLGRHIPKGTDVFLAGNGPGFHTGDMPLGLTEQDDEVRSPGARKKSGKMLSGLWADDGTIGKFKPERWLKKDAEGKEVFDPLAGPNLAFGLGPRGCFGKRLALVGLKMQFALIVWNFELLGGMPEEMSHFGAVQKFAREPEVCFVRLRKVDMGGV